MRSFPFSFGIVIGVIGMLAFTSYGDAEETSPDGSPWNARFEVKTFVLDLEKQGLEDNTFQNGIGRDTTLIGNFLTGTLTRRYSSSLATTLGVFAAMPFGHDTEISRINPIVRLDYRPREDATAILGTLRVPHDRFFDAIFDDANRWVRPIEKGAQVLTDFSWYRQDLFINWAQAFHGSQPRRFDLGYAGQLRAGPLAFNAQVHWVRNGQALLKFDRSFDTRSNLVSAFGPELALRPASLAWLPDWWREVGVRLHYLTSYDEPEEPGGRPTCNFVNGIKPCHGPIRGRGYELQVWLDLNGWRPRIGFWRGEGFLSQQGDPEYAVRRFTEIGFSKTVTLAEVASIEVGSQVRKMPDFFSGSGDKWVNQTYFQLTWNLDTIRPPFSTWLAKLTDEVERAPIEGAEEARVAVTMDTLTYVYNVQFAGLDRINGRPLPEPTYAGEYLSPVLQYQPRAWLNLTAGVFAGLPVGSTQPFHTVQPVVAAELQPHPRVLVIAGTLRRDHPLLDAIFDDATLFTRPVEQGFQFLVDHPVYRQDLFINWYQVETAMKPERFDIGYAGRLTQGMLGLDAQFYWDHAGGAQFSENRSLRPDGLRNRPTLNNTLAAVGPDVSLEPSRYWPGITWFRELQVMAFYLYGEDQPADITQPVTSGRGYLLTAGVDLAGWRPYVAFWRGENFVTVRGDPAYAAHHFTEYGFLKDVALTERLSLRLGGLMRTIQGDVAHTEYLLLNWSLGGPAWRGFWNVKPH